jgi:hypothetical protein
MVEDETCIALLPNPVMQHLDTWGLVMGSALPTVYALRSKGKEKKEREKENDV